MEAQTTTTTKPQGRRLSSEEKRTLANMLHEGKTPQEVADALKCSRATVSQWSRVFGVQPTRLRRKWRRRAKTTGHTTATAKTHGTRAGTLTTLDRLSKELVNLATELETVATQFKGFLG